MNARIHKGVWVVSAVLVFLALLPAQLEGEYFLSLGINMLQFGVLATAWALFSGPTRYISLATTAFFGIGAYTVAVLGEVLPWPVVLIVALLIGSVIALLVGLSTLRLSGVHFVIFSFGLASLVHQLVNWYEVNVTKSLGRYVFVEISQRQIYWQLLALLALVLLTGWLIRRSRLGLALRVIGEDETVARHLGINTTNAKLLLFVISAGFMTLAGAVMAPRWTYIDPAIAFNPNVSFQVLIMALLGGAAHLLGPLAGVIPLTLLFEFLSAKFPNHFSLLLGIAFIVIVYLLPNGLLERLQSWWPNSAKKIKQERTP
jgi:branched-chain amino acid transport system permease protein